LEGDCQKSPIVPAKTPRSSNLVAFFVVVALLLTAAGLLMPALSTGHPTHPEIRTHRTLYKIKAAALIFRANFGDGCLVTNNWVAELTASKDAVINGPKSIYLHVRLSNGIPVDYWNQPIIARYVSGERSEPHLHFYSNGKNGYSSSAGNDSDDINTWNEESPWIAHYRKKRQPSSKRRITFSITTTIVLTVIISASLVAARRSKRARIQSQA
jgi:hypothetical protein